MILFVDDQPKSINRYIKEIEAMGYELEVIDSIKHAVAILNKNSKRIQCIVLDVMFPDNGTFSPELTNHGFTTGMPLYASIRSILPKVPVIVLTNSFDPNVEKWFSSQEHCFFYRKANLLPSDFAHLVKMLILVDPESLINRLDSCLAGKKDCQEYQKICVDILTYLFVPPMTQIHSQVPRSNGHDVRDAIIENSAATEFWKRVYNEFNAKHIVFEFKNFKAPIRKKEVQQLRNYLKPKSLGRFGIIISRTLPSPSAITEQKEAYTQDDILILFIDDELLKKMIAMRLEGKDPALELRRLKAKFELSH